MAGGWASDGAVQEQIDSSIDDAIQRARSQLHTGQSLTHCEQCDAPIPQARR
ncbi:MAG: TraR/DksA family transcriptional regulator, partial [Pseudomonas marincola]